jgi:hypothetical protein
MVPKELPEQLILIIVSRTIAGPAPLEIIAIFEAVQPFASVTLIVYVPAHRFVALDVVINAGDHKYVYGGLPPDGIADDVPSQAPQLEVFVEEVPTITCIGWLIITVAVAIDPSLTSVTDTV